MAEQLNYQHNGIAAALRSGHTHIIGVILPTTDRSFFASLIRGIEQVAQAEGYNVMITQSHDQEDIEVSNVSALLKSQVDGIIASIARDTTDFTHYQELGKKKIPLVLCDRVTEISQASTVVIDDYLGAYRATEHLIQQGCRRIAHFAGKQHLNIYKYRLCGYRDALEAYGLAFQEELVLLSNLQFEDGQQLAQELLRKPELPDAIFAASDYSAMGAMQVLKANGKRIPEEVAIVGFANEPFCSFVEPALSSVNQSSVEMGQFAARALLKQVRHQGTSYQPHKTVLTPELIIRASSQKQK